MEAIHVDAELYLAPCPSARSDRDLMMARTLAIRGSCESPQSPRLLSFVKREPSPPLFCHGPHNPRRATNYPALQQLLATLLGDGLVSSAAWPAHAGAQTYDAEAFVGIL